VLLLLPVWEGERYTILLPMSKKNNQSDAILLPGEERRNNSMHQRRLTSWKE